MKEKFLALRKMLKSKKPNFTRQDTNRGCSGFNEKWVRPRGMHSKMRLGKRGHHKKVSIGYGGPKIVKGLTKNGFQEFLVKNVADVAKLNPDVNVAIISSVVGTRKKLKILESLNERNIAVVGIKDLNSYLLALKETKEKKKKESLYKRKKRSEAKEKSIEEKKKKEEEAKAKEEKDSDGVKEEQGEQPKVESKTA